MAAPRVAAGDGATSDERLNDSCQLSPSPTCLRTGTGPGTGQVCGPIDGPSSRTGHIRSGGSLWPTGRARGLNLQPVSGETIQNVRALDTSALHAHPLTHSHMRTRSRPACIVQTHSQAQYKHVSKLGPCTLDTTTRVHPKLKSAHSRPATCRHPGDPCHLPCHGGRGRQEARASGTMASGGGGVSEEGYAQEGCTPLHPFSRKHMHATQKESCTA